MSERRIFRDVLSRLTLTREALVQMLADPRWFIVRRAAELLGEMGAEEAERPLAELLRHDDERVRRAVTRALSRIESAFTFDAVARQVNSLDAQLAAGQRDISSMERIFLDFAGDESPLSSFEAFVDWAGRYRSLGFTEVVVHWPIPDSPYDYDVALFERIATEGRQLLATL